MIPINPPPEKNQSSEEKIILMQIRIFGVLLMVFSVLLFFSLVSYTSKDAPNLQISFSDWFSIFSDDTSLRLHFDTTLN